MEIHKKQNPACRELFYHKMTKGSTLNDYRPLFGDNHHMDGTAEFKKCGLVVNSQTFKRTVDANSAGWMDRFKWFTVFKKPFLVRKNKELSFEARMSGKQFFDEKTPVPTPYATRVRNPNADPRLASSGLLIVDPDYRMVHGFLITNQMIYALTGRFPQRICNLMPWLKNAKVNKNIKKCHLEYNWVNDTEVSDLTDTECEESSSSSSSSSSREITCGCGKKAPTTTTSSSTKSSSSSSSSETDKISSTCDTDVEVTPAYLAWKQGIKLPDYAKFLRYVTWYNKHKDNAKEYYDVVGYKAWAEQHQFDPNTLYNDFNAWRLETKKTKEFELWECWESWKKKMASFDRKLTKQKGRCPQVDLKKCCPKIPASFFSMIPLLPTEKCQPLLDYYNLAIKVDAMDNSIHWFIDGKEYYVNNAPGHRTLEQYRVNEYGGSAEDVQSKRFLFGFGNLSWLDGALPNNYDNYGVINGVNMTHLARLTNAELPMNERTTNAGIYEKLPDMAFATATPANADKLFGQGSVTMVRELRVLLCKKDEHLCGYESESESESESDKSECDESKKSYSCTETSVEKSTSTEKDSTCDKSSTKEKSSTCDKCGSEMDSTDESRSRYCKRCKSSSSSSSSSSTSESTIFAPRICDAKKLPFVHMKVGHRGGPAKCACNGQRGCPCQNQQMPVKPASCPCNKKI